MKIGKVLLATAGATVLLGALVSSASAREFSLSNQSMRAAFSSVETTIGSSSARCQLTLEGSLHSRTFRKVTGSLVGYITSAIVGPCNTGTTATILRETLPWHVRYSGFLGTLPGITSIITHVVGAGLRMRVFEAIQCLFRTTAAEPGIMTFHRNITTHEITEAGISGTIRAAPACFGILGTFRSNSAPVSLLGTSSTRISVSLI
jgi:hypothetical protein